MRTNTYDAATGTRDALRRPRRGDAHDRRALRRALRRRAGARRSCARPTRWPTVAVPDAGATTSADRLLLLDRVGRGAPSGPASPITYTNNWPHEPLIDNRPTAANVVWSIVSVVLLLAGIGALVWWQAFRADEPNRRSSRPPPIRSRRSTLTPSMRAVAKYLGVVVALFVVQVALGAMTAHYTRRGAGASSASRSRSTCPTPDPHLAHPDGRLLDRDRVPRGRPVPGPGDRRRASRASSGSASTCCSARCCSSSSGSLAGE